MLKKEKSWSLVPPNTPPSYRIILMEICVHVDDICVCMQYIYRYLYISVYICVYYGVNTSHRPQLGSSSYVNRFPIGFHRVQLSLHSWLSLGSSSSSAFGAVVAQMLSEHVRLHSNNCAFIVYFIGGVCDIMLVVTGSSPCSAG